VRVHLPVNDEEAQPLARLPTARLRVTHRERAAVLCVALAYGFCMLGLSGASPTRLYGASPYHRFQAAALLDGSFSLARSIDAIDFDTAWYNGGVQQVWGLGVPIWLVPFETVGRLVGAEPFPDRIPMGIALFLFAFYAGMTAVRLMRFGASPVTSFGVGCLPLFAPPLLTLIVDGPQTVYEDASVYALIVSSSILLAAVRVSLFSAVCDFWICCTLGALAPLVRPTHGIYGLLGVTICGCVLIARKTAGRHVVGGVALFLAGAAFLMISNRARFGSSLEFGHRLTSTTWEGILTSRFVNPIEHASAWAAAKELFGATFFSLGDIRGKPDFGGGLFPGQTPFFRWRNWYVTTFDPSLLVILCMGLWCAGGSSIKSWRHEGGNKGVLRAHGGALTLGLLIWAVVSWAVIFKFLMYYSGLCARYLYDFWPGFLALALAAWIYFAAKVPRIAAMALVTWLGCELLRSDCRLPAELTLAREQVPIELASTPDTLLSGFHGRYDADHHPLGVLPRRIADFWDKETGRARPVAMVPVDRPAFVELVVDRRIHDPRDPGRADSYRARIGVDELRLVSVVPVPESTRLRVRFEVPAGVQQRAGVELLFLCFVSLGDREDLFSERVIHSISWR
jgi:hypothetical protein